LGRHDEALEHLARAAARDAEAWGEMSRSHAASFAFFRGDDAEVERLLPTFQPDPVTEHLPQLMKPAGLTRHQERKGHYIVYVDETLGARKGQEWLAKMMELIHQAYSKVFPFPVDERLVSRVYVFGEHDAYARFNASIGHDGEGAAGYFAPSTR